MDISGLKVVVVEDSADLAQLWSIVFQRAGISALFFATGEEALSLIRQGYAPDILMTDYRLPDMTGAVLIETARQFCQAKFLMVTGERDCQAPEGVSILIKPVGMQLLIDKIQALAAEKLLN